MNEWGLHQFFQQKRQWDKRFWLANLERFQPGDPRRVLALEAEAAVADRLNELGYRVARPQSKTARWDLLIEGVRVEVKAANWRWREDKGNGRYQWHYHNDADLVILAAKNGRWHFFVLPIEALDGRQFLAVYSKEPELYSGQFRPYLEAWDVVEQVASQVEREYQPALPGL